MIVLVSLIVLLRETFCLALMMIFALVSDIFCFGHVSATPGVRMIERK